MKINLLLFFISLSLAACSAVTPVPAPTATQADAVPGATAANPPVATEPRPTPSRGERIIEFSGYEWTVRDHGSDLSGPVPNLWDASNVWLDENGKLHLRITQAADGWHSAEVTMTQPLGFGRYQFQIDAPIDQLDPNVVLGLFNYPTEEIGPDGTNEIDIEFAHWGDPVAPIGNFTIWPAQAGIEPSSHTFEFQLNGTYTTQRFIWESQQILFQSLHGHTDNNENEFANFLYQPEDPLSLIGQQPEPVHINLWLFKGRAPTDGNEVEVIIHSFTFSPR